MLPERASRTSRKRPPSEALIKGCLTESLLLIGDVKAAVDESREIIHFFRSHEPISALPDVKVKVYQLLLFVKASVCLGSTFDAELVGDIAGRLVESPSVSENTLVIDMLRSILRNCETISVPRRPKTAEGSRSERALSLESRSVVINAPTTASLCVQTACDTEGTDDVPHRRMWIAVVLELSLCKVPE